MRNDADDADYSTPRPAPPIWGGRAILKRGVLESLGVRGVGAIAAFAAHWALTQALPIEGYGAYVHVLAWIGLLALPCTLGYHLAGVRLAAAYDADGQSDLLRGVLSHSVRVAMGVSSACAFAGALVAWSFNLGGRYTALAVVAGAAILPMASVMAVAGGIVRGLRHIAAARAPAAILRPLLIGGIAFGLAQGTPSLSTETALVIAFGGYAAAAGVTWGIARVAVRKTAGAGPVATRPRAWRRIALPLLGFTALEMLLGGMTIPLIALILGDEATAVFGVAQRIAGVLLFFGLASGAILGPVIAGAHARGELRERSGVLRQLVRIIFALTALSGALVWVFAEPLLALFGDGYVAGGGALQLLIVHAAVGAAFGPQGLLLAMTDRTRALMWVMALTAALQLLGLLLFVPTYGIVGAAAVICATVLIRNVPLTWIVQRQLGLRISIA